MRSHIVLAEAFRKMARDPLGEPPRIDEHESGAVLAREFGKPVVNLRPDLAGHHRFEGGSGQFQGQITFSLVAAVDDDAIAEARV